jgi:quinol-cytochrome oxidoreductase complex cytochrome b subunit
MLISSAFITAIYFTSVIFKHFIFDTEVKRAIPDLPLSKILFWFFIANFLLLGFIGARPIETPYYIVGQLSSIAFFMYFPVSVVLISFETGLIHESTNNCGEILTTKSSV